jgi:hypothetical protein
VFLCTFTRSSASWLESNWETCLLAIGYKFIVSDGVEEGITVVLIGDFLNVDFNLLQNTEYFRKLKCFSL